MDHHIIYTFWWIRSMSIWKILIQIYFVWIFLYFTFIFFLNYLIVLFVCFPFFFTNFIFYISLMSQKDLSSLVLKRHIIYRHTHIPKHSNWFEFSFKHITCVCMCVIDIFSPWSYNTTKTYVGHTFTNTSKHVYVVHFCYFHFHFPYAYRYCVCRHV